MRRLRSSWSQRRAAPRSRKRNTTSAPPTPKSRSATSCPIAEPASAYGVIGKTEEAYFRKINAEGGINGRKINFISYDDGYSPPKTVEQARKLIESDEVLLIFNSLGTAMNSAIQKYMNSKKIPQLFVATGATKWNEPKEFPWTMGWQPNYQSETHLCEIHPQGISQRQDRGDVPERRLRQGLPERPERRSRRQGGLNDRRRGKLRELPNRPSTPTSSS